MLLAMEVSKVFVPKTPEFYEQVMTAYEKNQGGGRAHKTVYALRKDQDALLKELSKFMGTTKVGALKLIIDDWYRMAAKEIAVK